MTLKQTDVITYLLGIGNIVDGVTFYGPFTFHAEALRTGEEFGNRFGTEWMVVPLYPKAAIEA